MDPQAIAKLKAAGFSDADIAEYAKANPTSAVAAPAAVDNHPDVPFDPTSIPDNKNALPPTTTPEMLATGAAAVKGLGFDGGTVMHGLEAFGAYKGLQAWREHSAAGKATAAATEVQAAAQQASAAAQQASAAAQQSHVNMQYAKMGQPAPGAAPQPGKIWTPPNMQQAPTPPVTPQAPAPAGPTANPAAQAAAKAVPQTGTGPESFLSKIAQQYGPIVQQAKAGAAALATQAAPYARAASGAGMALYSPSLNSGEDEEMRKIMEGYKLAKKHGIIK